MTNSPDLIEAILNWLGTEIYNNPYQWVIISLIILALGDKIATGLYTLFIASIVISIGGGYMLLIYSHGWFEGWWFPLGALLIIIPAMIARIIGETLGWINET